VKKLSIKVDNGENLAKIELNGFQGLGIQKINSCIFFKALN
jgi:hypothetical protein